MLYTNTANVRAFCISVYCKNMARQNCVQANNRNEQPATCNFSERSSENTRPSTYNGRVQTLCNISKLRFESKNDIW